MSQTLHILRKDWRRMRPWLYVWFGYLAVATAFAMRAPGPERQFYWSPSFLTLLGATLGVGWLVQQDRLVGTTAFWMARPIERWALLRAKSILAGLAFGALPVLCHAAVLLRFGLEPERWGWTLVELVVPWAAGLAAVLAMAAVTPTLAAFFAGSVAAYVLVQFIGMLVVAWTQSLGDDWTLYAQYGPAQRYAAMLLGAGLFAWVFVRQVLTRRPRYPFGAMAAAVAAYVVLNVIPLGEWMQPAEPVVNDLVRFNLDGRMPNGRFAVHPDGSGQLAMWTRLRVEPTAPERTFEVRRLSGRIECDGATAAFSERSGIGPKLEARHLERNARWAHGDRSSGGGGTALALRAVPEALRVMFDRPCTVSAEVDGLFLNTRRLGALRLVPGEQVQRGSYSARVERVDRLARSVTVTLGVRRVNSNFVRWRRPMIALVQPERDEWILSESMGYSRRTAPAVSPGPAVQVAETTPSFHLAGLDENWIDGAELVLLEQIPDGRIKQSFQMSDVRLEDTTDSDYRAGGP